MMPKALNPPSPAIKSVAGADQPVVIHVVRNLVSFEMSFLLFIFAGDFKNMSALKWFPVDFTLCFFATSFVAALILMIKRDQWSYPSDDAAIFLFVLFLIWTSWSLTWSSAGEFNMEKAIKTIVLVSWCFIASYMIVAAEWSRVIRFLRILMMISVTLLAYWSYYRFALGKIDDGTGATEAANYLIYSFHAKYLVAILTALIIASPGLGRSLTCATAVVAVFVLMLFIGGRGPLLWALFTVPLALLFLLVNRRARRYRTRFLTVLLCFFLVLGTMVLSLMWTGTDVVDRLGPEMKTLHRFETYYESDFGDSVGGRIYAQRFAFESWLEAPIIGWGVGEFKRLYPGGPEDAAHRFVYPHNLFLEVLMEQGLVGFALLAGLACLGLARAWKLWPAGRPQWPAIALILLFIPQLMSRAADQGFLPDERVLFALLGLILGLGRRPLEERGAV